MRLKQCLLYFAKHVRVCNGELALHRYALAVPLCLRVPRPRHDLPQVKPLPLKNSPCLEYFPWLALLHPSDLSLNAISSARPSLTSS